MAPARSTSQRAATFEHTFRQYYTALCGFAERYVGSAAEDVVQELFIRLWEMPAEGDVARQERVYLYKAVRNRCLQWMRDGKVAERATTIAMPPSAPVDAHVALEEAEVSGILAAAIAALPERMRMVFVLRREQGLSYAEIAEVMEISVSTVEVQMWKALKALRAAAGPYLTILLGVGAGAKDFF